MTRTDARRLKLTKTLEEAHALADRVLSAARKSKAAHAALPRPEVAGRTKAERKKTKDEIEAEGKIAARKRAEVEGSPRCEWFTDGTRCTSYGSDCDHVLGGTHKGEMEALPNGEGFQVECRMHHALKHGPGKDGHLAQAREHAIRIGSKGLRRAVEKAMALHEGKHGRAA